MCSPVNDAILPSSVTTRDNHCHGNTNSSNHDNCSNAEVPCSTVDDLNGHLRGTEPVHPKQATRGARRGRRPSTSTSDPTVMAAEVRKSRQQVEEMTQVLARVKLECAEAMAAMEQKKMEARQALLRESQAVREVDAARSYIAVLEQRVSYIAIAAQEEDINGVVAANMVPHKPSPLDHFSFYDRSSERG